ncbi:NAD(P)/FAD-dependent oxidoreductase [Halobacillus sp. MO56]
MKSRTNAEAYDVVIIGAGVIGNSIAYHLSEQNSQNILVIDKSFPLSGTSGSTQAWVWVHTKTPSSYGELSLFSSELYPYLERKIGDVEYKRTGGLAPFFTEEDREKAMKLAESQAKVGIDIKVLSRDEVLKKEPSFSPNVVGATFSSIDGNVNPFRLLELYTRAAEKNKVDYSFYNPVVDIEQQGDGYIIHSEKGTFRTKKLILAGGPWSRQLGSFLGLDIPVKLVRGQVLITEPLAPLLNYTIGGIRQANNGEVLIGYSKEEVGYNRQGTLDVIQETANMAVSFVPALANANVVRSFSGVRVVPEDGLPIFGEIPGRKNLYIATMHSGITLSPVIGTLMSELISSGETSLPIEKYSISRFA